MSAPVLDPASGSRMFYFDRADERVMFGDIRSESHTLCDGRALEVHPDVILDFRSLPFSDGSFRVVIFDPPHLVRAGARSWIFKKYGRLDVTTWREDLVRGFAECFRVLATDGVLIFKWNETQIPVSEVLALTDQKPLVGHKKAGKSADTHWITFLKGSLESTSSPGGEGGGAGSVGSSPGGISPPSLPHITDTRRASRPPPRGTPPACGGPTTNGAGMAHNRRSADEHE